VHETRLAANVLWCQCGRKWDGNVPRMQNGEIRGDPEKRIPAEQSDPRTRREVPRRDSLGEGGRSPTQRSICVSTSAVDDCEVVRPSLAQEVCADVDVRRRHRCSSEGTNTTVQVGVNCVSLG